MSPERRLHDGRQDGLVPLESLDLSKVHTFTDLLRAMGKTAFGGRQLGEAFDILLEMIERSQCQVVLTLSGAMTVAKQGQLICDLIDRGLVQAIVATGALIAHGLTESIGLTHYRYDRSDSDEKLFEQGYNRIYDTLEMEANLNNIETLVRSVMSESNPTDGVWSSARLCRAIGERLAKLNEGRGILRSASEKNVPVFIPAFTDSEIGLDVATWAMRGALQGETPTAANDVFVAVPRFNPFLDLQEYARFVSQSEELGILTIGGGVPRNWAQQVSPYYDVANARLGTRLPAKRFRYGVRICPEPVHWGGLSGCTYSEGVSWGKFVPTEQGGRYAEVYADATVVWPLLMKAIFEKLGD
ncbi:MAG: deoxyhypusine synthase family protein [Planctomycetaceae bacterium]|nr:deoxyhypusine synthase family protein [Planctomycetaceae bacterium]